MVMENLKEMEICVFVRAHTHTNTLQVKAVYVNDFKRKKMGENTGIC